MNQQQEVNWLVLTARIIQFATYHPYAATGIFGAMAGSAATYLALTRTPLYERVMQDKMRQNGKNRVVNPEVYEFAIPQEDLRRMLRDPMAELRWDMPTISVIITAEKREQPKELPDVQSDVE